MRRLVDCSYSVSHGIPLDLFVGANNARPSLRRANNDGGLILCDRFGQTAVGSSGQVPQVSFDSR